MDAHWEKEHLSYNESKIKSILDLLLVLWAYSLRKVQD